MHSKKEDTMQKVWIALVVSGLVSLFADHYTSDGIGGLYTTDGGHIMSDGIGGFYDDR